MKTVVNGGIQETLYDSFNVKLQFQHSVPARNNLLTRLRGDFTKAITARSQPTIPRSL